MPVHVRPAGGGWDTQMCSGGDYMLSVCANVIPTRSSVHHWTSVSLYTLSSDFTRQSCLNPQTRDIHTEVTRAPAVMSYLTWMTTATSNNKQAVNGVSTKPYINADFYDLSCLKGLWVTQTMQNNYQTS